MQNYLNGKYVLNWGFFQILNFWPPCSSGFQSWTWDVVAVRKIGCSSWSDPQKGASLALAVRVQTVCIGGAKKNKQQEKSAKIGKNNREKQNSRPAYQFPDGRNTRSSIKT